MSPKERVLAQLAGKESDCVPFTEPPIDPVVLKALFGAKWQDQVLVADSLGIDILSFRMMPPLFVEETPTVDGRHYQTQGKLHTRENLKLLKSLRNPTNPALYSDLDCLIRRAGQRPVIGMSRLGLSSTLMSMDLFGFSYALFDDRDIIMTILDRYLEWSAIASQEMCKRGVDALWFFDDFAFHSGPMMSPDTFRELLLPRLRKMTTNLEVPWVFHSDGDLRLILDDLLTLGMSALHPIEPESMPLKEVKRQVGNRVCLIGNVSVDSLSRGTQAEVEQEVRRCFDDASGGRYMISSSNNT